MNSSMPNIKEISFLMSREHGWYGYYFICRERFNPKPLDYYPSELIAYEYIEVYPDMFTQDNFLSYRIDGEMYIDIALSDDAGFDIKKYIVDDLKFCKYELLSEHKRNSFNILSFRSVATLDFNKLPEKLYFYALSPERFSQFKVKELYNAEHIRRIVENAYEQNISRSDSIKSYNVYEIPFQYTGAVLIDDEAYVAFGSGCFDASKALLVDTIENFLGI